MAPPAPWLPDNPSVNGGCPGWFIPVCPKGDVVPNPGVNDGTPGTPSVPTCWAAEKPGVSTFCPGAGASAAAAAAACDVWAACAACAPAACADWAPCPAWVAWPSSPAWDPGAPGVPGAGRARDPAAPPGMGPPPVPTPAMSRDGAHGRAPRTSCGWTSGWGGWAT